MAKQITDADIEKAFAKIREQVQAELQTSDQWKLETKLLWATDAMMVAAGLLVLYMGAVDTIPLIISCIVCVAFGLCAWANHATR